MGRIARRNRRYDYYACCGFYDDLAGIFVRLDISHYAGTWVFIFDSSNWNSGLGGICTLDPKSGPKYAGRGDGGSGKSVRCISGAYCQTVYVAECYRQYGCLSRFRDSR
ncbi:hypothetical protein D3C76_1460620 [compost metagenome]